MCISSTAYEQNKRSCKITIDRHTPTAGDVQIFIYALGEGPIRKADPKESGFGVWGPRRPVGRI